MSKLSIKKIDQLGLCVGCGFCEAICGEDQVKMSTGDDGFIHPEIKVSIGTKEKEILKICPGIRINNDISFSNKQRIWGKILQTKITYSNDESIRKLSSSGGTISALAIYALKSKFVDAVLQVGHDKDDIFNNQLRVTRNKVQVTSCSSSRYAPAQVFNNILNILENSDDTFCFIGKPCDISALKNYLNISPKHKPRFKIFIAFFCAGIPSFNATIKAIESFSPTFPVTNLKYRGNGWPGNFSFTDKDSKTYNMSYNDSWGGVLGRDVHFRCKLCPDGIGIQADITVGDAWETKNGFPDFDEKKGKNLTIVRTKNGNDFLISAIQKGEIIMENLEVNQIQQMQPFQYRRRNIVGARLLAFFFTKGILLRYLQLRVFNNLSRISPRKSVKEFVGTIKRLKKIK